MHSSRLMLPLALLAAACAPASRVASPLAPLPEPPADQAEVQGTPPSAKHVWVHGYWHWAGRKYDSDFTQYDQPGEGRVIVTLRPVAVSAVDMLAPPPE